MASLETVRSNKISVDALLELSGADRFAKSYAFLYAAFKRTEISSAPVRDALDCLLPFITPYLNECAGKQIDLPSLQAYLQSSFDFDIPLYALEQTLPLLAQQGFAEYVKTTRRYVAKAHDSSFAFAREEIETEFDEVVSSLNGFSRSIGMQAAPLSGDWGAALIRFLKSHSEVAKGTIIKVKSTLMSPNVAEPLIVGSFLKELSKRNPVLFDKVVHIFMGILVEEFISSMSDLGPIDKKNPVTIFYDTAVLLRLLGCSGRLLKTATDELTRYLQDLGFNIQYLAGNETEVADILNTLVYVKDSGRELEGETAEAVSAGEVSITKLRMLQNTFSEELARLSVFPALEFERDALQNAKFQIDEKGFSEYLFKQASNSGKMYGHKNRTNDASFLGMVMRLRKGANVRDLSESRFLFVTSNKFLSSRSRRWLIEQRAIYAQHCPPILNVGQIATIAWLLRDKNIAPEKASRELLLNCYAAVRPDAEWFRHFREGIEGAAGSVDDFAKGTRGALALQAARRIAQDESLGNSALVRELNMVEILGRAKEEADQILAESASQGQAVIAEAAIAREQLALAQHAELARVKREGQTEKADAVDLATKESAAKAVRDLRAVMQKRADDIAAVIVRRVVVSLVILFFALSAFILLIQGPSATPIVFWIVSAILLGASVLGFADMLGVPIAKNWLSYLRSRISSLLSDY